MIRFSPRLIADALALFGLSGAARAADAAHPLVLELFQSQGCSSCPPANANVLTLIDRPDILALSFGVTYWDQLGWTDTFASPRFTQRQWDYARGLGHKDVFTPQVVINGRKDGVGADPRELHRLIAAGERGNGGPTIALSAATVTVSAAAAPVKPADVWLVRYDPRLVQVPIKRGENGGKTLPHRDVVKQLLRVGEWRGAATRIALPPAADAAWRTAVLIQGPDGGPILAAARL